MIIIKSLEDIAKARLPPLVAAFATEIMEGMISILPRYDPKEDGYIILVTPNDTDADLGHAIGHKYKNDIVEGVTYNTEYNCYHTVLITNNQHCISIITPCVSQIDPQVIERMKRLMA